MTKVLESRRRYVYDMECDSLLEDVTEIHCLTIKDIDSGGLFHYPPDKVKLGLMRLYKARVIICHNQIGYDLEVIKKLYPKWKTDAKLYDTLLLSQMFWPDIGSHGLAAWGERLGVAKPVHEDWSVYSDEMRVRCNEDVKINFLLWLKCKKELDSWDWEEAIELEQDVARIHAKQVHHGFYFNKDKALNLLGKLIKEIELIDLKIKSKMPMRCIKLNQGKEVTLLFLKTGGYRQNVINYFGEENIHKVKGAYSRIDIRRVKTSETAQLKLYFLRNNWKPDEWNWKKVDGKMQRMSPKLTLSSLESSNITSEIGQLLIKRMMLAHRRNIISSPNGKGLLPHIRKRDGRIPSEAHTCGTPTARYRHMVIANFPRPKTPYGKDIRGIFGVPDDKILVGIDLAGIEARMMASYCFPFTGGEELAYDIIDGDFHQKNADTWEVSRDTAKSGLYATMYGAGANKLASTLMKPTREGGKWRDLFWDTNAALKELKEAVELAIKKNGGYVRGLDGRKVFIRDSYKALNSLFQCGAAIVFKRWMIMMDEAITKYSLDVHQVTAYHDETQNECSYEDAECFGEIASSLAVKAGEFYELNVPTPADPIMGRDWCETH